MGLFPQLVGDLEVRRRRERYPGEASYKRLSFVRPKTRPSTESWDIVAPLQHQAQFQNFWDHPQWRFLSYEQQRACIEQYRQTGIQPRFVAPGQIYYPQQFALPQPQLQPLHAHQGGHHGGHHGGQHALGPRPHIQMIQPRNRGPRKPKSDNGLAIFDVDSDSESRSSRSSGTTFQSSRSSRGSSGSSSSSASSSGHSRRWH